MPFQPGNKLGNKANHKKPHRITQHLIAALNEAADGTNVTKMRKVIDALIAKAIEGDVPAIREVIDRLDGKVPQALETGDGQEVVYVVRMPARPEDMAEWQDRYAKPQTSAIQ